VAQLVSYEEERFDGPAEFARFHKEIRTAEGESAPAYLAGHRMREIQKARALARMAPPRMQSANIVWTERGPANVPGRTRGLIVDPDDPTKNTWFAGSAGGGVWKTTNGGQNWNLLTPDLPNLATTVLGMAPSNHNTIYAGTGEGFGNLDGISGTGIFKSIDRGQTWQYLPSTANFSDVNRLAINPANADVVVVATNSGIYRTIDGGANWTQSSALTDFLDLKADPTNFNIQYAARDFVGVFKSTDGGQTWVLSNNGMSPTGRTEIAISPVMPSRIFASVEGGLSGVASDMYYSSDSGGTWSLVNITWNAQPLDFLGGQGWYDNIILCDPFNADIIYFGGVNLFRFNLTSGSSEVVNYRMEEIDTEDFLFLVTFANIQFSQGRLTAGTQAAQRDVEVRFGPGMTQKAHRFTVPTGATSGVPVASYTYANYVDVPFEVWEVTDPLNPRQLMVSFRDQANDGAFTLMPQFFGTDPLLNSREYVYINNVDYSATPSPSIMVSGGQEFQLIYNFFPALADGGTWTPASLPASTLLIEYTGLQKVNANTITVTDAYGQFDSKNRFLTFGVDVHPDQHNLAIIPVSGSTYRLLNANDGGVFLSNISATPGINQGNWTMVGNSYRTTQFYGADKRPGFDQYFGGTQDNGTWRSPPGSVSSEASNYELCFGGDGFEVIWHALDDQKMIGGSQGNSFQRSVNAGVSWQSAVAGLSGSHPFITKLANSQDDPERIYTLSSAGVFYSPNFGASWTLTPITNRWGPATSQMDVEVSRANANIVWAGSGMVETGTQRNVHVSTDAGVNFALTNNPPTSLISGGITRLASHPFEQQTAYALFSQAGNPKILRTTDLGQSWEDISGFDGVDVSTRGFPDVAVYCLYVRADDPNILWAGTEIGIVESLDNGISWQLRTDFPAISVWDMKGRENQVVIATHGRGIWTATLDVSQESTLRPVVLEWGTSPKKEFLARVRLEEDYDQLDFYVNGTLVTLSANLPAGDHVIKIPNVTAGQRELKIIGVQNNAPVHSQTYSVDKLNIQSIENSYATYFGSVSDVFMLNMSPGSFAGAPPDVSGGLHSTHPYATNLTPSVTVLHPVVVSSTFPTVFYEDIALVEPGIDGEPFSTVGFKDFVVLEASKNGLDWTPIEDGHDARYDTDWLAAYNSAALGTLSMFRLHQLNILDKFAEGDTLLFRYRLFSDASTTGWGTALRFISIQEEPTAIEKEALEGFKIYPNPATSDFTVEFALAQSEPASISLLDVQGRVLQSRLLRGDGSGKVREVFSTEAIGGGAYVVWVKTEHGSQVGKLLVRR
jgi:photosystem II stability/assembly factor-like uncharacterized protein